MQKIAILILAAGSSTRMGDIKQLLPYKHTTLLGWAIEQAQKSSIKDVFCVLGAYKESIEQQISKYSSKIIYNPNYGSGLSSSIVNGIKYLEEKNVEAILIMLADQPHITSEYLNTLIETSKIHPSKIIASNYKDSVGVPAIFPKIYFNELLNLKGDKGAKYFLQKHDSNVIKTNYPQNLVDIDTPNDYKRLLGL